MKKIRIWHLSDTHCQHMFVEIPKNIDLVIHSGDFTNVKNPYLNEGEARNFIEWYKCLDIPNKILVAGNHDTSIEKGLISKKYFKENGINYLEHESIEILGLNIFGSPYTPLFHDWAFNVKRDKLFNYWVSIPDNTDILVTHGPPKSILDNDLDKQLGDLSLYKRVQKLPNLKIHQFGHIHNRRSSGDTYINRGIFQTTSDAPKFINASFVDLHHRPQGDQIITELYI